jgi:hypothetical protein
MRRVRPAVLGVLVIAAACASEAPVASDSVLKVTSEATALQLTNLSAAPLHYMVIERGTLALVDWVACMGGPPCPTLAAGATVNVEYPSILGYSGAAQEGVVFWWREVAGGPGYAAPDSIHSLVVSLRAPLLTRVVAP